MYEIMKQKIYILGVVTVMIVLTGIIFKVNHWAGAGYLLTTGIFTLVLVFLPMALIDHYTAEGTRQNLPLYIVTWLTCFVVFTGMLFKIMHWPHAGTLLLIALPFPYVVFLPVFLSVTSKNKNFSIYNTVFVLLLLVVNSVFSMLLGLNVTKNRIDDSYNLSQNYNNLETALSQFTEKIPASALNLKIDEALKVVNEYQEIVLKHENMTVDQWRNNPRNLEMPDSKGRGAQALIKAGDSSAGTELYNSLKALTKEMENTIGYEDLAKLSPVIFDLEVPSGKEEEWSKWKFSDNSLAWVLIYLDGLETNLKMIKATAIISD
jgi:hypothetical protein